MSKTLPGRDHTFFAISSSSSALFRISVASYFTLWMTV